MEPSANEVSPSSFVLSGLSEGKSLRNIERELNPGKSSFLTSLTTTELDRAKALARIIMDDVEKPRGEPLDKMVSQYTECSKAIEELAKKVHKSKEDLIGNRLTTRREQIDSLLQQTSMKYLKKQQDYYGVVLNSSLMKETEKLEGMTFNKILPLECKMIEQYQKKQTDIEKSEKYQQIREEVSFASTLAERMGSNKNPAKLIFDRLKQMKPGEHLAIPGGFSGSPMGGHAVMYLVKKESGGEFSFTVINTGEGIAPHHEKKSNNHYYDYKIAAIQEEDFTEQFWTQLMDFNIGNIDPNERNPMDLVYAQISTLKGVRVTADNQAQFGGLGVRKPQNKGICVYKSFAGYLKERLGDKEYHLYKMHRQDRVTEMLLESKKALDGTGQLIDENLDDMLKTGEIVRNKREVKIQKDLDPDYEQKVTQKFLESQGDLARAKRRRKKDEG